MRQADISARLTILLGLVAVVMMATACVPAAPPATPTPTAKAAATAKPVVVTAAPAPTGVAECINYLGLMVSDGSRSVEAALNSYRCESLYVDSPGRYPSADPVLAVNAGKPLELQLTSGSGQLPARVEIRLYPSSGVAGLFLRWPEERDDSTQPIDSTTPTPARAMRYIPRAEPGTYSLVVHTEWGNSIEVFYAVSVTVL